MFASFDEQPLAAATIAQVHAAKLPNGQEVVVKIVRPGIRALIERDIEVLYALADLAQRYWSDAHRLRPVELVREYEKTILDELDLMREAANAAQLKRNFAGSRLLYVPEVYWDHCRKNVMVMERVRGVLVSDMAELQRRGANIQRLAENGVEIFFTQVFRHNFFHADMHPGNIFVLLDDPQQPRYAAVDFGIVGTLDAARPALSGREFPGVLRARLPAHRAAAHRFGLDSRARARGRAGVGGAYGVRAHRQQAAAGNLVRPGLISLFEAAQRFDAQMQPQLMLIQKTLLQIEGVGRQLYPDLDLWKTAQPLLRQWVNERWSVRAIVKDVRKHLPDMVQALQQLPPLVENAIQRASDGRLTIPVQTKDMEALRAEIRRDGRRRDISLLTATCALGGIVWLALATLPAWPGYALLGVSVVGLFSLRR